METIIHEALGAIAQKRSLTLLVQQSPTTCPPLGH
jgi:hypothetical protein